MPEPIAAGLEHAVRLLRESGCREVYVFGSTARGDATGQSDLDLAIRGCPPGLFFRIYGKLLREVDIPVDLVDLDSQVSFARHLERGGSLRLVA